MSDMDKIRQGDAERTRLDGLISKVRIAHHAGTSPQPLSCGCHELSGGGWILCTVHQPKPPCSECSTLRDRVQKLEGALREIAAEYERLFGNVATDPPFNNPGLANWTYHKCDQALSPNGTEGGGNG